MNEIPQKINNFFCPNCGAKIDGTMFFCPECGARIETGGIVSEDPADSPVLPADDRLIKSGDGKYRWLYEMNMWKNPTILITVYKVLGITVLLCAALLFILFVISGDSAEVAAEIVGTFLIYTILILAVLAVPAYILVSLLSGGKYCVVFEMDEKGVKHIQIQKQFKKARLLAMLGVLAGVAAGNATTAGANLLSWSKKASYSKFDSVRSIKANKKRNTIYLNSSATFNQIYVSEDQFDFVLGYLIDHCPKAKMK